MCNFDEPNVSFRFFLVTIGLLSALALYHQLAEMKSSVDEASANCGRVPQMDSSIKNIQKTVNRLKEELTDYQEVINTLRKELKLYKSDKTGLVDYAYGGKVTVMEGTETLETRGVALLGVRICGESRLEKRLVEAAALPGDCWPIQGHEGAATVELVEAVVVTQVSLEHAARDLLPPGSQISAPRQFSLWGVPDDNANPTPHFFGKFEYLTWGPEVQTFSVLNQSPKAFRVVEFRVHSNHGHPNFTCIYRLRVHGHLLQ